MKKKEETKKTKKRSINMLYIYMLLEHKLLYEVGEDESTKGWGGI